MIDNERIGRALRTLRRKAGFTQNQLANQLFVSSMAVSKWENGKSIPDPETLMKLSVILDMDVDGLLDGTATYISDRWHGALQLPSMGSVTSETMLWDKPIIDYLLCYFLLAGVRDILIACDERERAFIDKRFRGGETLGVQLRFTSLDGLTADAVIPDATQVKQASIMLITSSFFLYGVDLSRFLQRAMQHKSAVVQLESVVGSGGQKVREGFSHYQYKPVPVFFLQSVVPHGLLAKEDLRSLVAQVEASKRLRMEPLDKGFVLSALQDAQDVETVSTLVQGIQILGSYLIYCPLEVAWRRGMIDKNKAIREARNFPEYREYLEHL